MVKVTIPPKPVAVMNTKKTKKSSMKPMKGMDKHAAKVKRIVFGHHG